MDEHVTTMCERILRESRENFVASLATEPLTVDMRNLIERWYSDRAFLAEQAKLLWERLGAATEEVKRLRTVVRGLRGELSLVDIVEDLEDDPVKHAAWRKKYDAETQALVDETKESG